MSLTVTGTLEWQDLGLGAWVLVSESGETYELQDPPPQLCRWQGKVEVTGEVCEGVMTLAMVGPVLEVRAFTLLEG